jgi:hypothetical protein
MNSKDLVGLSHTVKVDRNNRQAVTWYLNEIGRGEEERLQGASSVSSPEHQTEPEAEEPSPGVTQEVPEL